VGETKDKTVYCVDLFCGGGGTSTGLVKAARRQRRPVDLVAVNHWAVALQSHAANHPWAKHIFAPIEDVKPGEAVPGGWLDILVASPPCTHFSVARGGRPVEDQKRSTPRFILEWLKPLDVQNILIENVPEWAGWGPTWRGQSIKSRKGEMFRDFINKIELADYTVEYKVLNAADYGGITTRRRLFVLAKRGEQTIHWPAQTHSKGGKVPGTLPWVAARTIIDWNKRGESIFGREARGLRPLADNTIRRILYGLEKFNPELKEFLVVLRGTGESQIKSSAKLASEPVPTISSEGYHVGMIRHVVMDMLGTNKPEAASRVGDGTEPFPSTHAGGNRVGLVRAFVLSGASGGGPRPVDSEPLPTVTGGGVTWLVEAHLQTHFGERKGQRPRVHSIEEPVPSVTSRGAALVKAFLITYHGQSKAHSEDDPVPSFGTKGRFAHIQPVVVDGRWLDIEFRMLTIGELKASMGFPEGYEFKGTKTQAFKQIGNAVEVRVATALCGSLLRGTRVRVGGVA
jgi:DNA (cytosine-5)-methyltransferase 1